MNKILLDHDADLYVELKTFASAEAHAAKLTKERGALYIACDRGSHCSPRFQVTKAPAVGDEVSRYFNGDGYPAGKIVSVSATLKKVVTETGVIFWRQRMSGSWVSDKTWFMVAGINNDYNRSF